MLYITSAKPGFVASKDITWQMGEHLDAFDAAKMEDQGYVISMVQADGDELNWLKENFNNLPHVNHVPLQKWRGESAQFIFDHLPRTWKK